MKLSLKYLLFASMFVFSGQVLAAEGQEGDEDEKKDQEIGSRFAIKGNKIACNCSDGSQYVADCTKACSGVFRGGWKRSGIKEDGPGLVQLTKRGFKCVCNRKNSYFNCTSAAPARCGGITTKKWTQKLSFKDKQGQNVVFNSKTEKYLSEAEKACFPKLEQN